MALIISRSSADLSCHKPEAAINCDHECQISLLMVLNALCREPAPPLEVRWRPREKSFRHKHFPSKRRSQSFQPSLRCRDVNPSRNICRRALDLVSIVYDLPTVIVGWEAERSPTQQSRYDQGPTFRPVVTSRVRHLSTEGRAMLASQRRAASLIGNSGFHMSEPSKDPKCSGSYPIERIQPFVVHHVGSSGSGPGSVRYVRQEQERQLSPCRPSHLRDNHAVSQIAGLLSASHRTKRRIVPLVG